METTVIVLHNIEMADINARLRSDLTAAMKARDALRSSVIRMVLTAVKNAEVSGKTPHDLSDAEALAVLSTEAKKRRESAEAFDAAGRTELAAKERAELEILADYLPEPLSEQQIIDLVADAIAQTGAAGPKDMGKVMGIVTPQTKGRADGSQVAAEVRRQLS